MRKGYQPEPSGIKNPTPPDTGSHVKPAPTRKIVFRLLQTVKESVDAYANSFDPCGMCKYKSELGFGVTCHVCCYFYASQFEPKDPENQNNVKG